ncbi:uncharacterized protein LOC117145790 [Drosophila mauritiana]|uniref:Uncharacterized protein LOC117145790 n=1 Tax=Drosophila mauritiana TaxID=7226 RepID=A0A6P8KE21_DROMA|nr:uncharacterized protein LOC117145790 [Drosophila mauritiana]
MNQNFCKINHRRVVNFGVAVVSHRIKAIRKPMTLQEISASIGRKFGVPGSVFEDEIKVLLEEYQPFGFFIKRGNLYSLPPELLAIMKENDRDKRKRTIKSPQAKHLEECDQVYGCASNIDHSMSLRHPYLYRFN